MHEVWAAPATSLAPSPRRPPQCHVASPCPASAPRSSLGPCITLPWELQPLTLTPARFRPCTQDSLRPGTCSLRDQAGPGATGGRGSRPTAQRGLGAAGRSSCRCLAPPAHVAGWAVWLRGLACLNRSQRPLPARSRARTPEAGAAVHPGPLPRTRRLPLPNAHAGRRPATRNTEPALSRRRRPCPPCPYTPGSVWGGGGRGVPPQRRPRGLHVF